MNTEKKESIENLLLKLNLKGYTINNLLKKAIYVIYEIGKVGYWNGKEYIDFVKEINKIIDNIDCKIDILMNEIPDMVARLTNSKIKLYTNGRIKKIDYDKCIIDRYVYIENEVNDAIYEIFCYFKEVKKVLKKYEDDIGIALKDECIGDYEDIRKLFCTTKHSLNDSIQSIKLSITTKSIICRHKKYRVYNDEDNKSLGIIIPAYNAKSTIKRTLYSIASQRILKSISLNVYVINDFSDYNYQEIIKPLKKYYNVQELNTGKNVGPGLARQFGIDNSSEDYILFMDADDYFASPYSLQTLYNNIIESKADIVISKFASETCGNLKIKLANFIWMHGKIYNRAFLEKNNIRFNDTRANEDCGFNYLIKYHRPSIKYIDDITYIWSENKESITRKNNSSYEFYGLEGFCYNVAWAGNMALQKGLNAYDITITTLRAILSMWTAYSIFYNRCDVDKIIQWTKPLKEIYDKKREYFINRELLNIEIANKIRTNKEENRYVKSIISFEDFINKIDL